MSKSAKSKNATLKKVKKLVRQGKYLKALRVCDEYLDNALAEEILILMKIDILVEYYNTDEFIALINEYKIKLTHFLEENQEIELLKIYNTLDNYLELKTQNLANEGIVQSYIAGGLLIDNMETILVLNEMVKDNYESIKSDAEYIENRTPHELEGFVDNVMKTSYQYLELILENPKEQIANANFDLKRILIKIRKLLEPKNEEDETESINAAEEIEAATPVESEEIINDSNEISELEEDNFDLTDEGQIEEEEISELEEKSVVTLAEIVNPEENDETDILEIEDNTEIANAYSDDEEIQGLKDIVSDLNDKNEFKKALTYQRKLVKLARDKNIKAKEEVDSEQKTLSDF